MNQRKYLHLTGGLGNQLFQLAAAVYFAKDSELHVLTKNGKPRTNKIGEPEIFSFVLPNQVTMSNSDSYSKFISRVCGFIIRISASPRNFEKNQSINLIIRLFASIINTIYLRYPVRIMKVKGVGYAGPKSRANLLIGYYQTFKYVEEPIVSKNLIHYDLKIQASK